MVKNILIKKVENEEKKLLKELWYSFVPLHHISNLVEKYLLTKEDKENVQYNLKVTTTIITTLCIDELVCVLLCHIAKEHGTHFKFLTKV